MSLFHEDSYNTSVNDFYKWGPWEKKFAWLPIDINQERVWLKSYYMRHGFARYSMSNTGEDIRKTQYATIFDILKS